MRTWAGSAVRGAYRVFAVAVIVAPAAACGDSTATTVSSSTPTATTPTSTSPVTTTLTTTSAPADCAPADLEGADALRFVESNDSWIVEGCYADIIEPLLAYAEYLVFLNPGVDVCVEHCMARPWEPEKFDTKESQNDNLSNLIGWVRQYEVRDDEYGLKRHRALYESFPGRKVEYTKVCEYEAELLLTT